MPDYTNMKFPPYRFVEFPKVVRRSGYPDVIAQTASEELSLLQEVGASPVDPHMDEKLTLARENERLRAELARLTSTHAAVETISVAPIPAVKPTVKPTSPVPVKAPSSL